MSFKNFHIENKAGQGRIALIGEINWWKNRSDEFTRLVDKLISEDVSDLDVYINSPGGDMLHANEIVNQLNRFAGTKNLTIGAIAASAAFTIALSFKQENTSCYKNTMGMYHNPSGLVEINRMADFDSSKKLWEDLRNDVVKRISERIGLSEEKVSENMDNTTWLNSDELKKNNIVGKILDSKDKIPSGTKNSLQNSGIDIPGFINEVEESELDEILNAGSSSQGNQSTDKNQKSNHNQVEMKELAKKLGLHEDATATEIANAIEALQNKASFGENALINLCVAKGIKKENAEKSVQNNFAGTLELVNGIETPKNDEGDEGDDEGPEGETKTPKPTQTRPSNIIDQLKNEFKNLKDEGDKTWNDYTAKELENMEEKEPKKFNQLFENEFGTKKS